MAADEDTGGIGPSTSKMRDALEVGETIELHGAPTWHETGVYMAGEPVEIAATRAEIYIEPGEDIEIHLEMAERHVTPTRESRQKVFAKVEDFRGGVFYATVKDIGELGHTEVTEADES